METSKNNQLNIDRAMSDKIIERIKEKTKRDMFKITAEENNNLSIFDSKFGGLPYWDVTKEYPTDSQGKKLIMIAQINFEKEHLDNEILPKKGILQFFIATDDIMGADFDNLNSQKDSRVIYHENVNYNVTEEEIKKQEIKANYECNIEGEEYLPTYKQYAITFKKDTDHVVGYSEQFEKVLKEVTNELLDIKIEECIYDVFPEKEFDYIGEALQSCGHKVFGYPFFTQWDPRDENSNYKGKKYDVTLLQIDSEDEICWGDAGVGNFFINEEDLKNKNFTDVVYNWDCY